MNKEKIQEFYLGVDVGNGYTKARKVKFASRVKVGDNLGLSNLKKKKDTYSVKHNGQNYIVGTGGIFTGDERYYSTEYKLCLLTAIVLNSPNEDFIEATVCVGLPVEKHELNAHRLVELYYGTQHNITVDGKEYTIRIKDFTVFIEGAYPILTADEDRIITIDMGAGTINVTEFFEQSPETYATYPESMYKLYQDVSTYLNTKKGGDFLPTDIETILNKKTTIIKQQEVDITDIRPIIEANVREMASLISNAFNVNRANKIYCIGGGSMDTYTYWKKVFPTAILVEDSQNVNTKVYDLIARRVVGE